MLPQRSAGMRALTTLSNVRISLRTKSWQQQPVRRTLTFSSISQKPSPNCRYSAPPRYILSSGGGEFHRRYLCAAVAASNSPPPAKVSALSLNSKKRKGKKITMVTAYDYPSAVHVARAGIDIVLVGDSVAMVELGHDTTQQMTLETMIHHCISVKRGIEFIASAPSVQDSSSIPLLVGDMPLGTYEFENTDIALTNAYCLLKEGRCDAIKLEGGSVTRAKTAQKIVEGGVAVMGHIGLTPQAISVIGGFRAQGRTAIRARALLDEALRLQDSGCFAIVLECVPSNVAAAITDALEIPTIGIGAGGYTSGQVLVFHDMLGMLSHPHHDQFVPKFCKKYAQVGHTIQEGLSEFVKDVQSGEFPGAGYSPYVMSDGEKEAFELLLARDAEERQRLHEEAAAKLSQADEYEALSLYGSSRSSNYSDDSDRKSGDRRGESGK